MATVHAQLAIDCEGLEPATRVQHRLFDEPQSLHAHYLSPLGTPTALGLRKHRSELSLTAMIGFIVIVGWRLVRK